MNKSCSKCKEEKSIDCFWVRRKNRDGSPGYYSWCKSCTNVRRTPEKNRRENLKYKYKMTVEEYNELFENQGGKCALCKLIIEKVGIIDHCHKTGRVRG